MITGISTISEKGQVTIPKGVRELLRLSAGDKVIFRVDGNTVTILKAATQRLSMILEKQRPWPVSGIAYQRRMREEWR